MSKQIRKYVLWFAQDNFSTEIKQFRQSEIKSIAKMFGIPLNIINDCSDSKPFWVVEVLNEEDIKLIASRSFTLKYVIKLFAYGETLNQFHEHFKRFFRINSHWVKEEFTDQTSFKINVKTFNKKLTQSQKVDKIESLQSFPLEGPVDLMKPQKEFYYMECYNKDTDLVKEPSDVLFGIWVAFGRRDLVTQLSLKNRQFIGNTSMEPQLALLMINQALVKPGDLVYDPFVGSGSILVSAAKVGAFVLGSDIDFMMLHGQSKPSRKYCTVRAREESVLTNLKQYNCQDMYLDVFVSDFSQRSLRTYMQFDAIITDRKTIFSS